MHSVLRQYWHPVGWAVNLKSGPMATVLLGEPLVVWLDVNGHPVAGTDRCPHRGTALSLGTVDGKGCLVCPYHGWSYDASGRCVAMPQLLPTAPIPERARIATFHCN